MNNKILLFMYLKFAYMLIILLTVNKRFLYTENNPLSFFSRPNNFYIKFIELMLS